MPRTNCQLDAPAQTMGIGKFALPLGDSRSRVPMGLAGFPSTLLKHAHFPVITDELILAVKKENPVYNAHRKPKGDF